MKLSDHCSPEESALAVAADMERRAWHSRLPAARMLCDGEAMRARHVAMLTALLVDPSLAWSGSRPGGCAGQGSIGHQQQARPAHSQQCIVQDLEASDDECGLPLAVLLEHYSLLPRGVDPCEASAHEQDDTSSAVTRLHKQSSSDSSTVSRLSAMAGCDGSRGISASDSDIRISVADLATACGRGPRTMAVLAYILGIAKDESSLAADLRDLEGKLRGLLLIMTAERVAGCLLLLNLGAVASELEGAAAAQLTRVGSAVAAAGVTRLHGRLAALHGDLVKCVRVSWGWGPRFGAVGGRLKACCRGVWEGFVDAQRELCHVLEAWLPGLAFKVLWSHLLLTRYWRYPGSALPLTTQQFSRCVTAAKRPC